MAGPTTIDFKVLLVGADGEVISSSNPLPVEATLEVSDLEIGAVELKDGSSDRRATVDTNNRLEVTTFPASAGTGTKSNVAASATSVTLLAANANRKRWSVENDSSVPMYLDTTGGTATSTSRTVAVPAGGYFEGPSPVNLGAITAAWQSATGAARLVEWA